jgi:hypothetical protein
VTLDPLHDSELRWRREMDVGREMGAEVDAALEMDGDREMGAGHERIAKTPVGMELGFRHSGSKLIHRALPDGN